VRNGFRVWDTHTHLGEALHSGRSQSADELLRSMDREGVDRSVVIPFPVVADYRAQHDLIASAMRAHPDRLTGTICLDPFVPRARFDDEVRRCAEELGFRALKLQPQYQALNPLWTRNDFFWEAAARHRLPVIVHTGAGAPYALPSLYISVARRFPGISVILAHAGGGVYVGECIVAADVCPNICVELSSLMPHHVGEVMRHVPSSRLLIGSDLIESTATEIGKIVELDAPASVKEDILWNTAERLFGGGA
jgi:predicted TIM-barrel fold metal-dependent hydrolase